MICMWLADATATVISCFIKIQIGLTFLVPAYPGCLEKEAINRVSNEKRKACFCKYYYCRVPVTCCVLCDDCWS